MKKQFYLSISAFTMCLLLLSCNTPIVSNKGTNEEETRYKSITLKVYKAIETGDTSGIDTLFTTDFLDHFAPGGKELTGRDSAPKVLSELHNQIKDVRIEILSNAYDKDYLMSLFRMTGVSTVPMNGMPAGTKVNMKRIDVLRLQGGKVAEHWQYSDSKTIMEMMSKEGKIQNVSDTLSAPQ